MRKAAAAAVTSSAVVSHGVQLAVQVSATAADALRTRRDPAVVARRRRRAAQRRLRAWSAGAIVSAAVAASSTVSVVQGGVSAGAVGLLVLLMALLIWCVVGIVRGASDLRARTRIIAALPAASPRRPAVDREIRPEMARLDGYSDGLRHLVGMIGIVDDAAVRALRAEILDAADTSEARLRRQALDLTGLIRARRTAPADTAAQLDATSQLLRRQIRDGVTGYGQLVSAAGEAVAASRSLADHAVGSVPGAATSSAGTLHPELEQPIDQLRSLAAGMRELTGL